MTAPNYFNQPTGTIDNAPIINGYQSAINRQRYRGVASLTHGTKRLVFRTNPNSVMWSYKLNTAVENTYGGRVIQVLSTAMEDLKIVIECGLGGWNYAMTVAEFMRNMLVDQRDGKPGFFEYTTRNYRLKVFAVSIPFQDRITETTREIELNFKIQEDLSGDMTRQTIATELSKLQEGIGFSHNQFNTGTGVLNDGTTAPTVLSPTTNLGGILTSAEIPTLNPFAAPAGNLFGTISKVGQSIGSFFGS